MTTTNLVLPGFLVAAMATFAACGSDGSEAGDLDAVELSSESDGGEGAGDLDAFVELSSGVGDADYDPLASPAEAIDQSDSVVVARDLRVVRKLGAADTDRPTADALLIHGTVEENIAGATMSEFNLVYSLWDVRDPDAFESTLPTTPVLLFLYAVADVEHFDDLPEGPLYYPHINGIWFRASDGDVVSGRAYAPKAEVESWWGPIHSFDDLVQLMRAAADPQPAPTADPGAGAVMPFEGNIQGIQLGVEAGPTPECATPSNQPLPASMLPGTFFDLRREHVPAGMEAPPRVGVCADDQRVMWLIANYRIGGGMAQFSRWESVRWYPQLFPHHTVSAGTIAGRPAVFVRLPDSGNGQSAVIVVDEETQGSSMLLSTDVDLDDLIAVMEALYGPRLVDLHD